MSAKTKNEIPFLPDDVDALKNIIAQKDLTIATQDRTIALNEQHLILKDQRIALLEEYLRLQKVKQFSASSEKSPDQQEMFNEAELSIAAEEVLRENDAVTATESAQPKAKSGRKPLPENLPRIRIEYDIPEADKICDCGCQREVIGEDVSEQYDIVPAKVQVLVHVRKKYACKQCEEGIVTAPLPAQPIPKSNASPGLLAHVCISKFQDALPLYRQEVILQRYGFDIPRNTLANWMIKSGELIQTLLNRLEEHLLAYPVLHCDETVVQVLNEPDKPPTSQSYMWVRVGGPPTRPIRLFHYADSRAGSVATQLLDGYKGFVQTDDYGGYNAVSAQDDVTQMGCWAHARRKFVEAQKATASGKNKKTGKADMAISMIGVLYAIEKKIKDSTPEVKREIRQQESVPQLKKIREWLDKTLHSILPKGLLGKALSYLNRNWDKLTVYTEDGRLDIDNNAAENAIRPFVVGRKNWLFSASVRGAKSSANLYSLIETAKANGLEPYAYLRYVFKTLPGATTDEQINALLPWMVKADRLLE